MKPSNRAKTHPIADFTPREERVAALLAAGRTVVAAAAEAGVSERQIHAWKHKPGFAQLVDRLRAEMLDDALGRLASLATKAVDTLGELIDDPDVVPSIRLSAARGILSDLATIRESVEFSRRLNALESAQSEGPRHVH